MSLLKLNLGCGSNKLAGWENHDQDIDISKRLPWPDGSARFILCEHCIEHIPWFSAILFLKECHRVLAAEGIARIAVPSIERIMRYGDSEYFKFAAKFNKAPSPYAAPTMRDAMSAILYCHGHQTAWTESLLYATIYYAGFNKVVISTPGWSNTEELQNVEGHHKIIGEHFNSIETVVIEGHKT